MGNDKKKKKKKKKKCRGLCHEFMNMYAMFQLHPPRGFWGEDFYFFFSKIYPLYSHGNQSNSAIWTKFIRIVEDYARNFCKKKSKYLQWDSKTSRKLLRIKVTPDLHLSYSKNGGNLGLVLKMKNMACLSILLTKHVKYTYLYLFRFVLYSTVAFKAN